MDNPRIYLGASNGERVYWEPKAQRNQHFVVVGTSGSGKTETLKAIVHELKKVSIPSLIIDFHNEYGDTADQRLDLREFTINPLEVLPGRRPQDVIYEVANIMKKVFKLGDQQEAFLRTAIKTCYTIKGYDILQPAVEGASPKFMEIRETLEQMVTPENKGIIRTLLNRIDPLFEVDIFFEKNTVIPFDKLLQQTTAIELKDFPTEDVKSAIAEFFLNKFIYSLYNSGRTDKLRFYCLVDEAHRLLYDNSPLDRLMREVRKYGAGVILSSQRPRDFNETILANTGGILSLQCNLETDAKFIAKQMGVPYQDILNLNESGLAYLKLTSETRVKRVKIDRVQDRGGLKAHAQKLMGERPKQSTFGKELQALRESLEEKNKEIQETLHEMEALRDENKMLEKQLKRTRSGKKSGKLCRKCAMINEHDAHYCNRCGELL